MTSVPSMLIAIGLSGDGVHALGTILQELPAEWPAAFVITQHRRRDSQGALVHVLARRTKLTVKEPEPGEMLRPGVVYMAPPDRHLVVDGSQIRLSDAPPVYLSRPSIDVMFRSVAVSWGPRAIAVILSGIGRDGARALQAVREAGGTTIVQDPADARFAALPQYAIAAGHIHYTLPVDQIGRQLMRVVAATATPAPADTSPATAVDAGAPVPAREPPVS